MQRAYSNLDIHFAALHKNGIMIVITNIDNNKNMTMMTTMMMMMIIMMMMMMTMMNFATFLSIVKDKMVSMMRGKHKKTHYQQDLKP